MLEMESGHFVGQSWPDHKGKMFPLWLLSPAGLCSGLVWRKAGQLGALSALAWCELLSLCVSGLLSFSRKGWPGTAKGPE